MTPDIIAAVQDENLFLPYLSPEGDLTSWERWLTMLRCLYGLQLTAAEYDTVIANTGRDPDKLPHEGFLEALLLCGRRSGKSKIIALVAAYEAVLTNATTKLSPGEIGMVAVLSPTRFQSRIVHEYVRAVFDSTPLLANEVVEEKKESFLLKNGIEINIITGDPKAARGFTLIAAVVDEIAMHGLSEESKVKSDTELVRALRPSLGTTGGRLLCIGTPYRAMGYAYSTFQRSFGNDSSDVLCWNAPSLEMNRTLNPAVVERAVAEDPVAAKCEYVTERGAFREDVDDYISRTVIESLVVPGRTELPPRNGIAYKAFCDMSGGMADDAAICVAHREHGKIVIDCLKRYPAPHRPQLVVAEMVRDVLKRYGCNDQITGDWYSAGWVLTEFEKHGIGYYRANRSVWKEGAAAAKREGVDKSRLYMELLPFLHSGQLELPDDETLVSQLASLQRSARSGRDKVDHAPNAHDDCANAVAGAVYVASQRTLIAGAVVEGDDLDREASSPWQQELARFHYRQDQYAREQHECNEHYNGPIVPGSVKWGPEMPLF